MPDSAANIIMIKLRWASFVTYTIIQSITSSEMCSLHLTHPSAHTLGAVGSRHCVAREAVGGFGALLKGLTSVSPQKSEIKYIDFSGAG